MLTAFLCLLPGLISALPPLQLFRDELQLHFKRNGLIGRESALKSRLPSDIVPSHYHLAIIPIIDELSPEYLTAPGRVVITATCIKPTKLITLNSVGIHIRGDLLTVTGLEVIDDAVPVEGLTENIVEETIKIVLGEDLEAGKQYSIDIVFVSRVANDSLAGLYLSKFEDTSTGNIDTHVATQFEAIDARKAFPCFDEPAFKATFLIQIGRLEDRHSSLSNMDQDGDPVPIRDRPGYVYDNYFVTPAPMSTYLVAIIVMQDFPRVDAETSIYPPARVSVWGPQAAMQGSDAAYSADTAASMLAFFDVYMDHVYDFPKFDSVAVGQFAYGAMENWGLNIYRVQDLLYSETEMTTLEKWRITYVIAHEVCHQWIGNVVTMDWWTDLWLNEGLANYLQFLGADAVHPEYAAWERFTIDASQSGLHFDARLDAVPVHGNNETHFVTAPFEGTYQKGSALFKMLEGFLTKETLQRGLQRYIRNNMYENVHQDDLFEALTLQAELDGIELPVGLTVKNIMDSWTLQSGFPLIRVSRTTSDRILISQERFSNALNTLAEAYSWDIPIPYLTQSESSDEATELDHLPKLWIQKEEILVSHILETTDEWILLNPDAYAFYRVLYDDHFTQLIITQLAEDHTRIPALSRGQIIDDYFKCAFGEYISIKTALELTEFLNNETEVSVWVPTFNNIKKVHDLLSADDEVGGEFQAYFLDKVSPAFESVGDVPDPEDSPVIKILRTHLLNWACSLGHPRCFASAKEQVDAWMNSQDGINSISTDLQPSIYCAAAWDGGRIYRDFFLEKYVDPPSSVRQRRLFLRSFACPSEQALLTEALDMALADVRIRPSDAPKLMGHVAENIEGRDLALRFIQNNVDFILESRVGEMGIGNVTSSLANYYSNEQQRDQVQTFLEINRAKFSPNLIKTIESHIIAIDGNIAWMSVHGPGIREFFLNTDAN